MTVTSLDPGIFGAESPCFGCAPSHPIGLKLRFEREGDVIRTRYVPREDLQGPPGLMHGGLVTTLADEIAAWTVIGLKERFGFTASLTAKLERPLRIGVEVVGEGTIARDSSRVVGVHVELHQSGERCFAGDFSFVILDRRGAERLLGGPLPAAWERIAR
jgi:acyl-coenzyme A thioesterase PaaI-like protein